MRNILKVRDRMCCVHSRKKFGQSGQRSKIIGQSGKRSKIKYLVALRIRVIHLGSDLGLAVIHILPGTIPSSVLRCKGCLRAESGVTRSQRYMSNV